MIDNIYHEIISAGWITALVLGICMLASRIPDMEIYHTYIRAKKILGLAYVVFGLAISQFSLFNLRATLPGIAVALPLSYFYLEGILFGMSFCSLLDSGYICRKQMRRDFGLYAGFMLLLWSGTLFAAGRLRTVILMACAGWFFIAAAGIAIRFLKIYRLSVARLNDYYADDVDMFVRWLHKSTYGIILCGLAGSVLAFAPQWCNAIFMFVGIVMFIYIYVSFQNYIQNYRRVETAVEVEAPAEVATVADDAGEAMQAEIEQWVSAGCYLTQGVTLGDLTAYTSSNRTYVSAHINRRYGCNFREWINTLRMEHAKKLLLGNQKMTVEEIARNAGFSSSAYFCRRFAGREGMTPTAWREQNNATS